MIKQIYIISNQAGIYQFQELVDFITDNYKFKLINESELQEEIKCSKDIDNEFYTECFDTFWNNAQIVEIETQEKLFIYQGECGDLFLINQEFLDLPEDADLSKLEILMD
ncbi:MAG: hypothetical protein GF347_04225 [Candidatus Moranbacteria bacterium]|nr:hypothetical protein [Candidatus Moranbacteria bacterium]